MDKTNDFPIHKARIIILLLQWYLLNIDNMIQRKI